MKKETKQSIKECSKIGIGFLLMFVLCIAACGRVVKIPPTMSNDDIIIETNKCKAAGLTARAIRMNSITTTNIICEPN